MAVTQSAPVSDLLTTERTGVGLGAFGREIPTETAVVAFQLAAGAAGAAAGIIAAKRLSDGPDAVPIGILTIPVAVAGLSTIVGAFLIPTEL